MLGRKVLFEEVPAAGPTVGEQDMSGLYELTALMWDEPYTVLLPNPVTGELVEHERRRRHRKGDIINLEHHQAKRLWRAGAIVVPGSRELAAAEAAERRAAAAAAEAKAARAQVTQLHQTVGSKATQAEIWDAGHEAGQQKRAAEEIRKREAWLNRPQTDADLIDGPSEAPTS